MAELVKATVMTYTVHRGLAQHAPKLETLVVKALESRITDGALRLGNRALRHSNGGTRLDKPRRPL